MAKPNPKHTRAQLLEMIDTQAILRRLVKCAKGTEVMTGEQLRAAFGLLDRTLPAIKMTEGQVTHDFNGNPDEISNAQLAAIVAAHSRDDAPGATASTH